VSDSIQCLRIDLAERSYNIEIGSGNLSRITDFLLECGRVSHAVVISDENVQKLHASVVAEELANRSIDVDMIVVEPGETSKSIDVAAGLWHGMLELGADRKTVVVAVGGGVVGDLAGFIAATYARGVRFLQVPTTLLSQVDSSVGGKVGINLEDAKNMVGAFLQPMGVLIDTATLNTLAEREYRSGLAEVVKYGVILDAEFFGYLEENVEGLLGKDPEVLRHVVFRCCELKASVVQDDEREETGLRAILNYGHTFGHAMEVLAGYGEILHGEAVSIGMLCASRLAEKLGRVDAEFTDRQFELLQSLGLPVKVPMSDIDQIIEKMMNDKKVQHGKLRFVLPARMGKVELVGDVDPDDIRSSLRSV